MQVSSNRLFHSPTAGFSGRETQIKVINLRCQEGQPAHLDSSLQAMNNTKASVQPPEDHASASGKSTDICYNSHHKGSP